MRKIAANYIFPVSQDPLKNGILITEDDGTVLDVINTGGDIRESENLEFYNGIITPGFVNAHCHLELSYLLNTIPRKTGLPQFLTDFVKQRTSDPVTAVPPVRKAHHEMEDMGIVGVGDISNTGNSFFQKHSGRILYHTFIEIFGIIPEQAGQHFSAATGLSEQIKRDFPHPASICPHAPYTVSDSLFKKIRDYCNLNRNIISIHNQETASENELFTHGRGALKMAMQKLDMDYSAFRTSGLNSLQSTLHKLPLHENILLVHNTYTTGDDIDFAENACESIYWVLCPGANLFIENRLPDVSMFYRKKARVAIGTDSLASNEFLSVLEEIRMISLNFPEIPLPELIRWGTLNGAMALRLDHSLGSFDKGKKPGVNLIGKVDFDRMRLKQESTLRVLA